MFTLNELYRIRREENGVWCIFDSRGTLALLDSKRRVFEIYREDNPYINDFIQELEGRYKFVWKTE